MTARTGYSMEIRLRLHMTNRHTPCGGVSNMMAAAGPADTLGRHGYCPDGLSEAPIAPYTSVAP